MSIWNLMKKSDILGSPLQLKHQGNDKFKTLLGSILSMIIIIITLAFTISQSNIVLSRSSPVLSLSNSISQRNIINLTSKFPIVFLFANVRNQPFNNPEKIYKIYASTIRFINTTQSLIYYNVTKCSDDIVKNQFGIYSNLFLENLDSNFLKNNNYYCLLPQNKSLLIDNVMGAVPYELIQITLTYCNNITSNGTCLSKQEISNQIENTYFQILTVDFFFDHKNYTSPGVPYISTKTLQVSSSLYKRYYMIYKYIEYFTDLGLVLPEQNLKTYYQLDFIDRDILLNSNSAIIPNTITSILLTMINNNYDVYYRSYLTLPQILANIGGAFNTLFLIGTFLNYYTEKKLKEIEILDVCHNENFLKLKKKKFMQEQRDYPHIFKIQNREFGEKSESEIKKSELSKSNLDVDKLSLNNKFREISSEIQKIVSRTELKPSPNQSKKQSILKHQSIIFSREIGLESLFSVKLSIINFIFPCFLSKNQIDKINFAEEFSNQMFDIIFIFGSLLEMQFLNEIKN